MVMCGGIHLSQCIPRAKIWQLTEKRPDQFLYNGIDPAYVRFEESQSGQKKAENSVPIERIVL